MNWKVLLAAIAFLVLVGGLAKADFAGPLDISPLGVILFGSTLLVAGIIAFDWVTDFLLLSLALHLVKFDVKKELRKVFFASIIGLVCGLIADSIGTFSLLFLWFLDIDAFYIYVIGNLLVTFVCLFAFYFLISKNFLKIDKSKAIKVAVFLGLFTNPVWLILISMGISTNFTFNFNPSREEKIVTLEASDCVTGVNLTLTIKNDGGRDMAAAGTNTPSTEITITVDGVAAHCYPCVSGSLRAGSTCITNCDNATAPNEVTNAGVHRIRVIGPMNVVSGTSYCP